MRLPLRESQAERSPDISQGLAVEPPFPPKTGILACLQRSPTNLAIGHQVD